MFSAAPPRPDFSLRGAGGWLLAAWLLIACWPAAQAQDLPPPEAPEAWLLTYGPGDVYWQRFGHNAIWLREPNGLDHTFNFGFFDFDQENFILNFVQGRLLYFAAAVEAERELAFYRDEGRSIRAQRLDLGPAEYAQLRAYLVNHVRPENREYLYDYYLDNCSTRLRDAIDLALGGALAQQFRGQPGTMSYRDHTRRSTQSDLAYYLGLELGLGMPVDHPTDRWGEMFLPAMLADNLNRLDLRDGRPLIVEDLLLEAGTVPPAALQPALTWPRYGLFGLILLLLLLGSMALRQSPPTITISLTLAWLLVTGTIGLGLTLVWGYTDHAFTHPTANLFLFNPLWLLAVVPMLRKPVAALMLVGLVAAVMNATWPGGQYLDDLLVLAGPVNLVVALLLWQGFRPAAGPRPVPADG